jgi:Flp pilus assembly protein TadD
MRTDFGVLEWNSHREAEAEREWRLALADMPDNAIALSNLGRAMFEKKRYQDAETYLQKAIALRPLYAAPHIHLGEVYAAEGDGARAEAELRRAVEIYPMNVLARNTLGKFYCDAGNLAEAAVQYRASIESLPNEEAFDASGDIYLREGAPRRAEEAWREAVRLSTFDGHAHVSLGNVYFTSGREAEAEKEYRIVLLLDPNNADALRGLRKLHPKEFSAAPH